LALWLLFPETFDPALSLLPLMTGLASEESESDELELDSTFFFLASAFDGFTEAAFFFSASF
jgi:hypothetical protein